MPSCSTAMVSCMPALASCSISAGSAAKSKPIWRVPPGPDMTATHLARILLSAVDTLYQSQPGDDATVLVLRCRPDEPATVMVGPPVDPGRDIWAVGELMGTKGLRAVCGGTTSQIVARVRRTRSQSVHRLPRPDRSTDRYHGGHRSGHRRHHYADPHT